MPNFTENLNLQLQLQNEFYDVDILNQNFKKIDAIDFEIEATKVTFEQLKQLIQDKKLIQGSYYILSDYQCTYKQPITETIMINKNNENLILNAISENSLSPIAFSDKFKQDIIYFTTDEILLGGKIEDFRGCILRRIDTKNNIDAPWDWRNIKLNRNYINIDSGYLYEDNPKKYKIINELVVGTEFLKDELIVFYDKIIARPNNDFKWLENDKIEEKFNIILGDYKIPIWSNETTSISKDIKLISNMQSNVDNINKKCENVYIKTSDKLNIENICLIETCKDVYIKSFNKDITIFKSENIQIGYNNNNIIINESCKNIEIGYDNKDLFIDMNKNNLRIDKLFNKAESQIKTNTDNITTLQNKKNIITKDIIIYANQWVGTNYLGLLCQTYHHKDNDIGSEDIVDFNLRPLHIINGDAKGLYSVTASSAGDVEFFSEYLNKPTVDLQGKMIIKKVVI